MISPRISSTRSTGDKMPASSIRMYSSTEKRRLMIFDISSPPEYRNAISQAKSFNLNDRSRQIFALSAISRENGPLVSRLSRPPAFPSLRERRSSKTFASGLPPIAGRQKRLPPAFRLLPVVKNVCLQPSAYCRSPKTFAPAFRLLPIVKNVCLRPSAYCR